MIEINKLVTVEVKNFMLFIAGNSSKLTQVFEKYFIFDRKFPRVLPKNSHAFRNFFEILLLKIIATCLLPVYSI